MSRRPPRKSPTPATLPRLPLVANILVSVVRDGMAADRAIEALFRSQRLRDNVQRGWIATTAYGCLRQWRVLCARAGVSEDEAWQDVDRVVATYLLLSDGWSATALNREGYRDGVALAEQVRTAPPVETLPADVRANWPLSLWQRLEAAYGEQEALALAAALGVPAPTDLRLNPFRAGTTETVRQLEEEGYTPTPLPYSPWGVRLGSRKPIFSSPLFRLGAVEVQDEASQLAALLAGAAPRSRVLDLCAGAGGKTLALAAAMNNTGTLVATDVSAGRLEQLRLRLKKAGVDNTRVLQVSGPDDRALKSWRGTFDVVLVDAPCSGTGTLRRNPDIKWRDMDLDALCALQAELLAGAARLVRPGGRLVYATCSVLPEENRAQRDRFLAAHPDFAGVPVASVLAGKGITIPGVGDELILRPDQHGTDGFYAAVLERRPSSPAGSPS